jgi:hypothetical protein
VRPAMQPANTVTTPRRARRILKRWREVKRSSPGA